MIEKLNQKDGYPQVWIISKINEIIEVVNGKEPEKMYLGIGGADNSSMPPDNLELIMEKFITHILWYHDKECGRTEDVEIIFASRIPDLADKIREWMRGIIEQCLTENDSDTHIIAKDLLEKIGE